MSFIKSSNARLTALGLYLGPKRGFNIFFVSRSSMKAIKAMIVTFLASGLISKHFFTTFTGFLVVHCGMTINATSG